jgi:hypothetical protein
MSTTMWVTAALLAGMVLGAVSLGAGIAFGMYREDRRRSLLAARHAELNPGPICGCGHHVSFHAAEDKGGCQHVEVVRGEYHNDTTEHSCGCVKYVGPEPVPTYYAGEERAG